MKNISSFELKEADLDKASGDIYTNGEEYFIGLSFEQEPELGEGSSSADISQYPLEDILDRFCVYISDQCDEYNSRNGTQCRLIFASDDIDDIMALKTIIGKHVYNSVIEKNREEYVELIIA